MDALCKLHCKKSLKNIFRSFSVILRLLSVFKKRHKNSVKKNYKWFYVDL